MKYLTKTPYFIFFIFLILFFPNIYAQKNTENCIDLLKKAEKNVNKISDFNQIHQELNTFKKCFDKKNTPQDTLLLTYYTLKKFTFFKANALDSLEKYIKYSVDFLETCKKQGKNWDKEMEIKVLKLDFETAILHHLRKKHKESITIYQKILQELNNNKDVVLEGKVYHNLAGIYTELYQYEGALEYIQKAKELVKTTSNNVSKGKITSQQIEIYIFLEKYKEAEKLSGEAILHFTNANLPDYAIAVKLRNDVLLQKQNKKPTYITLDSAKYYMDIMQKGSSGKVTKSSALLDMAILLIAGQKNIDFAKELLEKSLEINLKLKARHNIANTYLAWVNIHKLENNPQKVYEFYEKYIETKNEIAIEGSRLQLNGLKIIYDVAQQKQIIKELTQQQKITNLWLWLLASLVLFVVVIAVFIRIIMHQRLKISESKIIAQDLEIENQHLLNERLEEENVLRTQENKILEQENALKNRQLTTSTLHIIKNNETLEKLKTDITPLLQENNLSDTLRKQLQNLKGDIRENEFFETNWEHFKQHFEEVHPNFFQNLKKEFPNLTPNDMRHCAYIRMNLSRKEIAILCNVSVEAVKVARNRLKKKLNINTEDSLDSFFNR